MTQETQVEGSQSKDEGPIYKSIPHCDWCAFGLGSCGKCPPMTNKDRMALIEEIHAFAEQRKRELTVAEMDEIDRLTDQIHKEKLAWMNERSPIPSGATNALSPVSKASIEGAFNAMHSTNA
jgi:hypothetical protein